MSGVDWDAIFEELNALEEDAKRWDHDFAQRLYAVSVTIGGELARHGLTKSPEEQLFCAISRYLHAPGSASDPDFCTELERIRTFLRRHEAGVTEPSRGAIARAEALAAGYPGWSEVTEWPVRS